MLMDSWLSTATGATTWRATSLAAAGCHLGEILAAGEWKSGAFLRYCHAEELDVPAFLEAVTECDEDSVMPGKVVLYITMHKVP